MNSISPCCDRLLSNEEAANILSISPRTLANWRTQGWGPRYSRLTDSPKSPVIYRNQDIQEWINSRFEGR